MFKYLISSKLEFNIAIKSVFVYIFRLVGNCMNYLWDAFFKLSMLSCRNFLFNKLVTTLIWYYIFKFFDTSSENLKYLQLLGFLVKPKNSIDLYSWKLVLSKNRCFFLFFFIFLFFAFKNNREFSDVAHQKYQLVSLLYHKRCRRLKLNYYFYLKNFYRQKKTHAIKMW